jgi:hypothetical protein
VLIPACVRRDGIKTGVESVRAAPFQMETLNRVTDSVNYNLRRERERRNYPPGPNGAPRAV